MSKFEMTKEGCVLATEYLKSIGEYDRFMKHGDFGSVDGYTLTAVANAEWKKREELPCPANS